MTMKQELTQPKLSCDCCGKEAIGVASSSVGAISFAWCKECINQGAEPELMLMYLAEDVCHEDGSGLHDYIYNELKTFKDGEYITFREWYNKAKGRYPNENSNNSV